MLLPAKQNYIGLHVHVYRLVVDSNDTGVLFTTTKVLIFIHRYNLRCFCLQFIQVLTKNYLCNACGHDVSVTRLVHMR